MSNQHLVIATADKSKFDSLVDGSDVPEATHTHTIRATSRTVTASGSIAVADENNFIDVSSSRTAIVVLTRELVGALENFQFKVRVEYNASYEVQVQLDGTQKWILPGNSGGTVTYVFSIDASGNCVPENDGLSLTAPV